MTQYRDVADMPEDERIDLIGMTAMSKPHGALISFCTDDEAGKADRYISKLASKFPELMVVKRFNGPTEGCVTVMVARIMRGMA